MSAYTDAKKLQKDAQKFTREQWNWEKSISDTSHQREVADLKKAGLNPVLSSGGSGANYTSTSGDSGTGAAASVISSAQQAAATKYAAQQQAAATRAAAQAQIAAAQIAAAAQIDVQKRRNWQTRWNAKNAPQQSVAGVIDKRATNLQKKFQKYLGGRLSSIKTDIFKPSSSAKGVNKSVSSVRWSNDLTKKGQTYIDTRLKLMGIKVNASNRRLLTQYIYSGKSSYLTKLSKSSKYYI